MLQYFGWHDLYYLNEIEIVISIARATADMGGYYYSMAQAQLYTAFNRNTI